MLINLLSEERHVKDATGACVFGPRAGEWPAWYWDAVTVEEVIRKREANARSQAEYNEAMQVNR